MEVLNTFGSTLLSSDANKCHLIIQGNTSHLSLVLIDEEQKQVFGLKHFNFENQDEAKALLNSLFIEDGIFKYNFHKITFQYLSYRAMLVPETLFDSKNLKAFLKFHHNLDESDHIHYYALKQAEAYVIFSVPIFYEEILCSKYPAINYLHHSIPFIYNAIENRGKDSSNPSLHINFTKEFFDVLIVRNCKIQLFNSFFFKKYTDVIYFIVNILNLYSYLPSNTKLYVSGDIEENSELFKELKSLFKVPELERFNNVYKLPKEMDAIEQHKFVHLINANHCV
jgi:hypothetical protein